MIKRNSVFICYSHHDEKWLKRLQIHLKPLERLGIIERWDDSRIAPGMKWKEEISRALASARVAVLLISADFLASDFIADEELPKLLSSAKDDNAIILPVILSPCGFHRTHLFEYQAINSPDKPVINLPVSEQEKILMKVCDAIEDAFKHCI